MAHLIMSEQILLSLLTAATFAALVYAAYVWQSHRFHSLIRFTPAEFCVSLLVWLAPGLAAGLLVGWLAWA